MEQLSLPRRLALATVAAACLTFVAVSPAAAIGPSRSDPSNPPPPPPPPPPQLGEPSHMDPYDPV